MTKVNNIYGKITLFVLLASAALLLTSCVYNLEPTPIPMRTLSTKMPSPTGVPTASAPGVDWVNGNFQNQIKTLQNNMPRADSGAYVIPTDQEQADFSVLAGMLVKGDTVHLPSLVARNGYNLIYYVDRGDDKAESYLLRENRPIQRGWGLYAFRVNSKSNIIVEAPHPLFDRVTPSLALKIYRALDARALLVAGAHRNANSDGSADVAHAPESIFQSIHEAATKEIQVQSANAIVLQIHGFHTSKHDGYPQAILGFGEILLPGEIALAKSLEAALIEQGIVVGLCTEDSSWGLCGRMNVQASSMHGGVFIHIELDETIRENPDALIAALTKVFYSYSQ